MKKVDVDGQIWLGKKYAGRTFSMEHGPDGSFLLRPVKDGPDVDAKRVGTTAPPKRANSTSSQVMK